MKVYLLDVGAYDERCVRGVFSTPEKAMEAHQPKPHKGFDRYYLNQPVPTWKWKKERDGTWFFDADYASLASIEPYEMDVYV